MNSVELKNGTTQNESYTNQAIFQTSKIAKGGGISLFGLIIDRGITFLFEVLLARLLGISGYGTISVARSIFYIAYSVINFGLPQTTIRYGAIYRSEKESTTLKGLIIWIIVVTLGSGLLGGLLLTLEANSLATWFDDTNLESQIKILSWVLVPFSLATIFSSFSRAYLRHGLSVIITVIYPILSLILLVIFNGILKLGLSGASSSILLASILSAGFGGYVVIRLFPDMLLPSIPKFKIVEWTRFAIPMASITISYQLLQQSTRLILGYFSGSEEVGLFTAASALAANLVVFMLAINPVFAPLMAMLCQNLHEQGIQDRLKQTFNTATRWMFTLTLPLFVIFWVFGNEIMLMFGTEFYGAFPILFILSLSQFVNVSTGPVGMLLQMSGNQNLEFWNSVLVVTINIGLGILLTPRYNLIGAGIATAVAVSVTHLLRLLEVYFTMKILPFSKAMLKSLAAFIIALILTIIFKNFLPVEGIIWQVLIGSGFAFLIYIGILLGFGLESDDKQIVRALFFRMVSLGSN